MPLHLYGITPADPHGAEAPPTGVRTVTFRDLAALVRETATSPTAADEALVGSHREVVQSVFATRTLLPAPPGVTFRAQQALQRWMEVHYVALSDALAYVEDRAAARVHFRRAERAPGAPGAGVDPAATAAECMRALRRQAVAGLPLRTEHLNGIVLSSAFLVEREAWKDFSAAVRRMAADHPSLRVELTGPWPPYDFVRIEFGG